MLAVSPLRSRDEIESGGEMEGFSMVGAGAGDDEFGEFSDGYLLESINFEDLFVGINVDGDVLPDLEMDPEILAELSVESSPESENMKYSLVSWQNNDKITNDEVVDDKNNVVISRKKVEEDEDYGNKVSPASASASNSGSSRGGEESATTVKVSPREGDKGRKSSAQSKNSQGKRKVKVDWTPELHRRFVQAVEQLGVDKAVPSRILEIMGIDCLTRHNIASHLQKYRSHRKHLLAREAEAARWSQRRQMCGGGKREVSPWLAPPPPTPALGFPQMAPPMHPFGPLHVWGHPSDPTMDHSFMPMWPTHYHLPHPLSTPPLTWVQPAARPPPPPPPPPLDPSIWHPHQQRFGSSPVPGIPPPHAMFKAAPGIGVPTGQPAPRPIFDFFPSKESIDAAIGDVLSKPWLPLPLGLKAPALDTVLAELQRQGISKIPPFSGPKP